MATHRVIPFSRWWRAIKKKPLEQQQEIFTKWLYYACKTIANRGDQDQGKIVYTIATRYNKSTYKRMTKANAQKVYIIVNQKQYAHRKQAALIAELRAENENLTRQLGEIYRKERQQHKDVIIKRKKHRRIITGGTPHASS